MLLSLLQVVLYYNNKMTKIKMNCNDILLFFIHLNLTMQRRSMNETFNQMLTIIKAFVHRKQYFKKILHLVKVLNDYNNL
jgi:hypothetical protein